MALKAGIYTILWVPEDASLPITGGMYATGEQINEPIVARALRPSPHGTQLWKIKPVDEQKPFYTIEYQAPSDAIPVQDFIGTGWSVPEELQPDDANPVLLSSAITVWAIGAIDSKENIYRIVKLPTLPGATPVVSSVENQLRVEAVPINTTSYLPAFPKWQFTRVDDA